MKLGRFECRLENGRKVVWEAIDPYLNIIVGDNGVGKTLLLREVNGCVGEFKSIYVASCAEYDFNKKQSRTTLLCKPFGFCPFCKGTGL